MACSALAFHLILLIKDMYSLWRFTGSRFTGVILKNNMSPVNTLSLMKSLPFCMLTSVISMPYSLKQRIMHPSLTIVQAPCPISAESLFSLYFSQSVLARLILINRALSYGMRSPRKAPIFITFCYETEQ